jgi:hypothetical protein
MKFKGRMRGKARKWKQEAEIKFSEKERYDGKLRGY